MAANDDTWEERIERARRLRDAVATGGHPELGEEARDIVVEALDGWLALDERHLAEVRRKLPPGDVPAPAVPDLPPAPWRWQQVTPEPSLLDPQPKPQDVALVAADGTWVLSVDGGYGSPEIADVHDRVDPDRPSRLAEVLAAAAELYEDLDDALLEAWDVAAAHGQVGPVPETARDIVVLLSELTDTVQADARLLAAETKRLWGLAGPAAMVSDDVAEALDRHWRTQAAFHPDKVGPEGPGPDEDQALRGQITDRYRDEQP